MHHRTFLFQERFSLASFTPLNIYIDCNVAPPSAQSPLSFIPWHPHSTKVRFLIWLAWLFIINLPPFTKHGCHWGSLCKTRKSGIQARGLSVQWRYSGITLYYVQCFQNGGETLMYWFSYQSALLDFSFTTSLLSSRVALAFTSYSWFFFKWKLKSLNIYISSFLLKIITFLYFCFHLIHPFFFIFS